MSSPQAARSPAPSPEANPPGRKRLSTVEVSTIEIALAASVARVTANTARNFPVTTSNIGHGEMSSVSIVPRSFSPAIASIAG